ncbi:U32 family peptidase [Candidatus Woesearchaeota archaeon]|nr:U32 family peptidase [Candidatus Woesearchaeota archaeon]
MKKIELLAPAGNLEILKTAIDYGADAVYFAGKRFGARAYAPNFTLGEIEKGADYAHLFEKKAYVAVNTLLKNSEFREALDYINELYAIGVDAVIVQDFALAKIIKENFSGLEVHASTQATIHNSDTIDSAKQFDRVILARELTKLQIKNIIKKTKTPVEIFVHGALCFSFSGQCLMSSIIGGRSGNRGRCAQPCRKPYNIKSEKKPYLLSTADLCLIDSIPEIIKMGVAAIKIEGRMKNREYVKTVVSIYRKAIDSFYKGNFNVTKNDIELLMSSFNRTFTKGFFNNEKNIIASEIPTNRSVSFKESRQDLVFKKIKKRKLHVNISIELKLTKKIKVELKHKGYEIKLNSSFIVQKAEKKPLTQDNIKAVFSKIKDTPFQIDSFKCILDDNVFVPFSKLTNLRDKLFDNLILHNNIRFKRPEIKPTLPEIKNVSITTKPEFFVKVYDLNGMRQALDAGADIIYYNIYNKDINKAFEIAKSKLFFEIPSITYDEQIPFLLSQIKKYNPSGILIGNPALLKYGLKQKIHLNYSFNLFNDYNLSYWNYPGIISPELNFQELDSFKNRNFIVFVHGNLVVMSSKQKIRVNKLADSKREIFPVRINPAGYTEILNSRKVGLLNYIHRLLRMGVRSFYMDLEDNVKQTILIYNKLIQKKRIDLSQMKKTSTTMHLRRGVE